MKLTTILTTVVLLALPAAVVPACAQEHEQEKQPEQKQQEPSPHNISNRPNRPSNHNRLSISGRRNLQRNLSWLSISSRPAGEPSQPQAVEAFPKLSSAPVLAALTGFT